MGTQVQSLSFAGISCLGDVGIGTGALSSPLCLGNSFIVIK
jgi:hypothetical protein